MFIFGKKIGLWVASLNGPAKWMQHLDKRAIKCQNNENYYPIDSIKMPHQTDKHE